MDFNEVKQWIDDNKTDLNVKAYLEGFNPLNGLKESDVASFVNSNSLLKASQDKAITKALDTYREKTLPGIIDEEMKKRNPEETPEQKRIRELETKLAERERKEQEIARKDKLRAKAKEINFDPELAADFAIYDDDAGLAALARHSEYAKAIEQRIRNEVLVGAGGNPPKAGDEPKPKFTRAQLEQPGFIQRYIDSLPMDKREAARLEILSASMQQE